ncbi:glycine betaine ABC transporter substrate-binding protein [Paralysiella testudinis]|nr:glycine betaine ABC transporter substrate-binding protein [Paralysiella testudinis]
MRLIPRVGLMLLGLLLSPWLWAACEKPIKFGALTWESGQFTSAVLRTLVEEGYGCATEEVPGANPALEAALAQDDIQVIGEQWVGRSPALQQAVDAGKVAVIGDTLQGGAEQGWYVPAYVLAQNPDLQSYRDLPRFAHLFADPENPGRARFVNCPSGWICEVFNTRLLRNSGLDAQFNNVHPGTGAALDATIAAAYAQQKPLLFYYWQPTGLMAKYDLKPIPLPAYNDACWQDLLRADGRSSCVSGMPTSQLAIAVSTPFVQQHGDLAALFARVQFTPQQLNSAILAMSEHQRSGHAQAQIFLREQPEVWRPWLSPEAALRMDAFLNRDAQAQSGFFPQWSVAGGFNRWLNLLVRDYGDYFRHISQFTLHGLLLPIERLLAAMPPWLLLGLVSVLAWHATRRWLFVMGCTVGLFLIGAFGLWPSLLQTMALLVVAVGITVVLGVPLGIVMARSRRVHQIVSPVLDVMQTMPSFVYLIPVLMLFGLGKVPALFATVVYALAPLVRLTALGIRQVSPQLTEAAQSFGSSRWQMLLWVVLPLAKPSIMAGVNQAVMMSLSMVVLASMIGAPGLGEPVLQAIQTLNIGQGLEAGAAIVVVAIVIDRITQAYGRSKRQKQTGEHS